MKTRVFSFFPPSTTPVPTPPFYSIPFLHPLPFRYSSALTCPLPIPPAQVLQTDYHLPFYTHQHSSFSFPLHPSLFPLLPFLQHLHIASLILPLFCPFSLIRASCLEAYSLVTYFPLSSSFLPPLFLLPSFLPSSITPLPFLSS